MGMEEEGGLRSRDVGKLFWKEGAGGAKTILERPKADRRLLEFVI
jgi:hypothetical protein